MNRFSEAVREAVMKYTILTLAFILFFKLIRAQQSDFNFINFSNKDGLSSNSVNSILKDKCGYMWFGTEDGLNKFDGVNFTVYSHRAGDSTSIGGNGITGMAEDGSGNLWISTNQTLSFYSRKKDAFINYKFIQNSALRGLCTDHQGNVWIGGYAGLFRFDPVTAKVKNYKHIKGDTNQLASNGVLCVFEDSRHRLWVGTNSGLNLFVKNSNRFKSFYHSDADPASVSDNIIRTIMEDPNGNIWFGTDNGLSKLQADGKCFKNYHSSSTDAHTLSSNRIYSIKADKDGKLWIGTEEGLNIFDLASEKVHRIKTDRRNKYSLTGKSVRSIFIDKSGIYWIGTFQGGVSKYDKNLAFFNLRQSDPFDPSGLSAAYVTSFVEGLKGNIYVGTDGGGLNIFNRETGLFYHPKLTLGSENRKLPILAMERVGDELWIGTYQYGLYVLNMLNGRVKHYTKGESPQSLSSNEIFCIKRDSKGNVWIGTNGSGVNVYSPKTGAFLRLDNMLADDGSSINRFIRAIEEDKLGNIWIGTTGSGVAIYDPLLRNCRVLNHTNSNLPTNDILTIHIARNGSLWVGTLGGGLSLFDNKTNTFLSYSEANGLSNAVIYKILEDDLGNLWVSTNKGLSKFDPKNGRFKNYSSQNGLQRSTFALGAGLKTSNGQLFFGGLEGFNYFDPHTLHYNKNIPSLQFTALKISNSIVVPGENAAIREHVSVAKEIRLDYRQNFSLEFTALNYTAPEETRYSYKLDGFDKAWNDVGTLHTAVYTNLDPGVYTFRVRATSDDGLWSTPEKTIKIYVQPPFWRTIYAYIFYALLTIGLIIGLRYRGIQKIKREFALEQEKLKVKQMIEEERKEAERQHEFDQLRIKFLTNLSHEFRTPISLIVGPVEKMLQQKQSGELQELLFMVERNANRLLGLVNQLLDFRKLEDDELKLNLTEADIVSFLREITDSFKEVARAKQIKFWFSGSVDRYQTSFDKDKIERIFLNLLSNAFKFTAKDGEVGVRVEYSVDSNLKIIVSDTGVGMTPDVQARIFDRFFQANENTMVLNQGSGIGLSIAKEFAKLHGGYISVESAPGKGSTFIVSLPLQPAVTGAEIKSVINGNELNGHDQRERAVPETEKLTVLLIEDNDDFRCYLKDSLKPFYKVVAASDGKEGWQKALSAHPQVVVSDINMPGMDGITLSRKLKSDKRTKHIPIILLTALTGDAYQLKGLHTGASDYLTKPFNFEVLNIKIKNLVQLNQSLKETYSKQLNVIPSEIKLESEDEKLITKITQYVENNLDSPDLNVEELSRHVYMSRGSLYNKIVSLTGETPVEFIRSIKLKKAAALLESSDMKISQIGYAVGFTSPNYFGKAFKAKYNVSPTAYSILKRGYANSDTN